jgi:hypothetical protein
MPADTVEIFTPDTGLRVGKPGLPVAIISFSIIFYRNKKSLYRPFLILN